MLSLMTGYLLIDLIGTAAVCNAFLWCLLLFSFSRALARGAARSAPRPPSEPLPLVSVIIAARNEEALIGETLQRLLAVRWPRERLEIIVADDRSTDATGAVTDGIAAVSGGTVRRCEITSVPDGWTGKKWALHSAIESARGDIILTTDADCLVGPEWIRVMTAPLLADGGPELVGGPVDYENASLWRWPRRLLRFEFLSLSLTAAGSLARTVPLVISAQNMAFTRDLYFRCGGHEPRAAIPTGDDVFLLFAADAIGAGTGYVLDREAAVTTAPPATARAFYHQRTRWASKGLRYPLRPLLVSGLAWLVNALLLLAAVATLTLTPALWPAMVLALGLKAAGELALLRHGRDLGIDHLALDYLTGLPLHIVYVTAIGLTGALGLFRWKDVP